jgi:hypothetical protein
MDTTTPSQGERAEMELVLQSGIFLKAPRLANFFRYVCERHLEGNADQIKEYSIAFEALGRPAEFDPKKDSIVRVEAHRLRKRLEEYYSGPGATHAIRIKIPNGQYRPCFLNRDSDARSESVSKPNNGNGHRIEMGPAELNSEFLKVVGFSPHSPEPVEQKARWRTVAAMAALCVAGLVAIWAVFPNAPQAVQKDREEVWKGVASEPVASEFRMVAGYHGAAFIDNQGHSWGPDAYYQGGRSTPLPSSNLIEGAPDPHFLRAERSGRFKYAIPLRQGTYELHLYFAETEYGRTNPKGGGDGSRMFQVSINNKAVLREFDPLGEAGAANRLHERVFRDVSPGSDGKLTLQFDSLVGPAFLNAIAILPGAPGRVHPIRIVTQPSPVTDSDGRVWAADEYFCGGTFVSRRNVVLNGQDKALFQGERYGNFFYHLPLPPGKYKLTLHFAETYFGLPGSNGPAIGSRIFNVFVNGEALLRNFQIAQDAGGPNRTVAKTFTNLQPNAQGVLAIEFVPVRNYAEVNAIEVVQAD